VLFHLSSNSTMYLKLASLSCVMALMAFSQTGSAADTLACVEVKSTPVTERGRSMVDVELTNHCSDDITAYAVGLSDRYGTEPAATIRTDDLVNLLYLRLWERKGVATDPYDPNDILRRDKALRLRLAVPPNSPKYLGEASVLALVFLEGTAIGDSGAIQTVLDGRREYLEGLVAIKRQLEALGEVVADKERFRERVRATKDMRERAALAHSEQVARDWMENAERASESPYLQSWQVYMDAKVKALDHQIDIYTKHSTLYGAK
jgi:hypothetical protein